MIQKPRSLRVPRNPIGWLILLAAFAAAAGCSTANTSGDGGVNHVDASGNSIPGWLTPTGGTHANSATLDYIANGGSSSCTECHGSDLAGGISRVSCFNTTGCHHDPIPNWSTPAVHGAAAKLAPGSSGFASCQICHGADFGTVRGGITCFTCHASAPHAPPLWRTSAGTTFTHTNTDNTNAPVCYQCHSFTGTENPNNPHRPPTPAAAGTPPGCYNGTMCHNQPGAPHPVPYNDASHYAVTSATFPGTCGACHDVSAPSTKFGPVCQTCHVAASPLTSLNCTSCHAVPPDSGAPAGAAYPNIAGAHSTHIALDNTGSPVSCDTCHVGLGPSLLDLNHYSRAKSRVAPGDVLFLATYYAKTGASSFDNGAALSCSNVSCHGGQATPNWQTGAVDVNNQCTICHTLGTEQYNSYNSGKHAFHLAQFGGATATVCKFCHNTTTLAVDHFTTLADNTISPDVASATIGGAGTAITTWTQGTGTSGTCNAVCHPGDRTW